MKLLGNKFYIEYDTQYDKFVPTKNVEPSLVHKAGILINYLNNKHNGSDNPLKKWNTTFGGGLLIKSVGTIETNGLLVCTSEYNKENL
jgi:hypothetical protein